MFRQHIFSVVHYLGNVFLNIVIGKGNTYLHVIYLLNNIFSMLHIDSIGNTFSMLHILIK